MSNKKSPSMRATELGLACESAKELRDIIGSLQMILKVRFPKSKSEPLPPSEPSRGGALVFVDDPFVDDPDDDPGPGRNT